ncbi:TetR/AcrR family transcriptional regulator [Metabacillus fastidiosus]|uniref:TetR/AcrR family transcriptional regulator n=1 Tax=Metabacillus fastidiosus TaxID=1458 RepID=UPI003D2D52C3
MKKKESTKDVILETASSLFKLQGYHGTGVSQIIEKSGAPKGSLYYHFPKGKEEIATEAVNLMKHHVVDLVLKDLSTKDNLVEAFQYHVNRVASLFDKNGIMDCLHMGVIASETAMTHESIRIACDAAYKDWQSLYAGKLEEFGFESEKAKELSVTINAMIEGACILSMTSKSGYPLRCIARQLPMLLVK